MAVSDVATALQFGRLFKRGKWTNNPNDANYYEHWNGLPLQPGERVREVHPVVLAGSPRLYENVRVTDRNVYIDTPKLPPAFGPIARPAKTILERSGRLEPTVFPLSEVQIQQFPQQHQVQITAPGFDLRGNTRVHVGSPSDLPPLEQLKHAWNFARGPR
jgi:hypothetical protein